MTSKPSLSGAQKRRVKSENDKKANKLVKISSFFAAPVLSFPEEKSVCSDSLAVATEISHYTGNSSDSAPPETTVRIDKI